MAGERVLGIAARCEAVLAVVSGALVLCSSAAARKVGCEQIGRVVSRSSVAAVVLASNGRGVYLCRARHRGAARLGADLPCTSGGADCGGAENMVLAGRFLAYDVFSRDGVSGEAFARVIVRDVIRNVVVHHLKVGAPQGRSQIEPTSIGAVDELRLRPTGSVGCLVAVGTLTRTTFQIFVAQGRSGPMTPLDDSPTIDERYLRLKGPVLSWLHSGLLRSVKLQ